VSGGLPAGTYDLQVHGVGGFDHNTNQEIGSVSLSWAFKITAEVGGNFYKKGDAVPGVAGATFTGFGVPAGNESSEVAFLGKWTSPSGSGTGIFAGGALVAKVGDAAGGGTIKSVKDPVIDEAGHVAFPVKLTGGGIGAANDTAVMSNAPGGTLA